MTPFSDSPRDGLEIRVQRDGDGLAVLPIGVIDMATTDVLEKDLTDAFESRAESILLDLEGVTFIDSIGLHLLLWAARRSQENGNRLRIRRGAGAARRLIELSGLESSLPLEA